MAVSSTGAPLQLIAGQHGAVYRAGAGTVTGDFGIIYALSAAVLGSVTSSSVTGSALTNVPLPAGAAIYGRFSSITVSSGDVMCYKTV
jgi:hypothetical protein